MDELHKISRKYYETADKKIRRLAKEFFKAMDQNGDKKVSLHEFLAFMKKEGYSQMSKPEFFYMLVKDGNTFLQKWEVMTLYYIINSGRPFCDGCGQFVVGMYFSCTNCFECSHTTFNVCSACFCGENFVHKHKEFLDNFTLLEGNRMVALKKRSETANTNKANMSQTSASPSSTSTAIVPAKSSLTSTWLALTSSTSTAIVQADNSQTSELHATSTAVVLMNPQNGNDKWKTAAWKFAEIVLKAGTIVAPNLCNIM